MLDLQMSGHVSRRCDGATRRDFLRVGGLGLMSLSLPAVLRSEAHAYCRQQAWRTAPNR